MIKRLFIQNLILLEKADISFEKGLQIITGETGSGKSALLSAVRLILGAKADPQLIRQEASSAVIEAEVEVSGSLEWLGEEDAEVPQNSVISLRREIHRSGKNRCFLDEQLVSLSTLKRVASQMIELVDQNSSASLCQPDSQRKWIDAFGGLSQRVQSFSESFKKERALEASLQKWLAEKEKADLERLQAEEDLSLIQEANLKSGEEESLAEEHTILSNAQQLLQASASAVASLSEAQEPLISLLQKMSQSLEQMIRFDSRLIEPASMIKRSALELEDAVFFLRSYIDELDADPKKLSLLEERLVVIEKLKKRFGTLLELSTLKDTLTEKLDYLSHLDANIAKARVDLEKLREKNQKEASEISTARKETALHFSLTVTKELHTLNMPHARFEVSLNQKPMASHGIDEISFLFTANPGHPLLPLEECASGGELSRVFLAIKTQLAEKDQNSCLIFDEIDSNVGGQTASILGEKLRFLAKSRQVISVTHFVQVAKCADHHFLVSKNEATTTVKKLSSTEQEEEFNRMLGV